MKHILIMESGSFKVIGGAAKDTYKIYKKLKGRKDYEVDIFGDFSKIDPSLKPSSMSEIMSKDYDLVWLNSIRDVGAADSYMRMHPNSKTKFMYVDRGNVLLNYKNAKLKKFLPKMIARRYLTSKMASWLDYYVAISSDQFVYAKRFFKGKTDVRYIMIAPHEEFTVLKKKKTFTGALSVSRLDERQKKLSFMINGIARVKEVHSALAQKELLRIVGSGVDEAKYRSMVSSLGLSKNIKFQGFMTGQDLIKEYNNAAFLVSTSEWEGLGRSLLEAMACGLPLLINENINTVIKDKPHTRIIEDGYNGLVYKYGDTDDFSDKFFRLYTNKRLQKKLASNTRKFMGQFSFGKVIKKYEEIIDAL